MKINIKYTITPRILNNIAKFAEYHGRLTVATNFLPESLSSRLSENARERASFSAIAMAFTDSYSAPLPSETKFKPEKILEKPQIVDYHNYFSALESINTLFADRSNFNTNLLQVLWHKLLNSIDTNKNPYRTKGRVLNTEKVIEGQIVNVEYVVNTQPKHIPTYLHHLFEWIQNSLGNVHPIIIAAATYLKISEIHPFNDGNGRLAIIISRGILFSSGLDRTQLIDYETYYLQNKADYYSIIERCIRTKDMTEWIEFYTNGLLLSIKTTLNDLYKFSGSTFNLIDNKIMQLTPREQSVISAIYELDVASGVASGAAIANKLKVSRQNIHVVLHNLHSRGVIKKLGKNTNIQYKLV